jgi:hypothetical protein
MIAEEKYYICPLVPKYYTLSINIIVVLNGFSMRKNFGPGDCRHNGTDEKQLNLIHVI